MAVQGHSQVSLKDLGVWMAANTTPVFSNSMKDDLGSYRRASLALISGEMMEQIIPEIISKPMKDKKVAGSSQRGFMRGKPHLTSWLNCLAQGAGGQQHRLRQPLGLMLVPVLFNLFSNEQGNGAHCTLSKSAGDTKLGEVVGTPRRLCCHP